MDIFGVITEGSRCRPRFRSSTTGSIRAKKMCQTENIVRMATPFNSSGANKPRKTLKQVAWKSLTRNKVLGLNLEMRKKKDSNIWEEDKVNRRNSMIMKESYRRKSTRSLFHKTSKKSQLINPVDLRARRCVGRGSFGRVILVENIGKTNGRKAYAMKEVPKSKLMLKDGIRKAEMEHLILEEVGLHPFIVSYYGSYQDNRKIYLMMEFVNGFELFHLMQKQGAITVNRVRLYVAELVLALNFLHDCRIVYRDLKPENILIDREGHVKLTDFGLSRKVEPDEELRVRTVCGTPEYLAPEIVRCDKDHGKAVDFWALGILTFEMIYQVPPFYDTDKTIMYDNILNQKLTFPKDISSSMCPKTIPTEAKDLMFQLLIKDESKRLGSGPTGGSDILEHPFFHRLDFNKVLKREYVPGFVPSVSDSFDVSNIDEAFVNEKLERAEYATPVLTKTGAPVLVQGYDWLQAGFADNFWYDVVCQ